MPQLPKFDIQKAIDYPRSDFDKKESGVAFGKPPDEGTRSKTHQSRMSVSSVKKAERERDEDRWARLRARAAHGGEGEPRAEAKADRAQARNAK